MRSTPSAKRRLVSGCLSLLLLLLLVIAAMVLARKPLLGLAARVWVISDEAVQADLIIVPGGQIATRPVRAAELYEAGYAPALFVMREDHQPFLHDSEDRSASVAAILVRAGVPPEAILFSESEVGNTRDEALAFRKWLDRQPPGARPRRVLMVTDAFHSRRARASFRREAPGIEFRVITVPHRKYDIETWWESPFGVNDFQRELLKTLYFRLRPLFGSEFERESQKRQESPSRGAAGRKNSQTEEKTN